MRRPRDIRNHFSKLVQIGSIVEGNKHVDRQMDVPGLKCVFICRCKNIKKRIQTHITQLKIALT